MQTFVYPAKFTPDEKDAGFVVTFPDLPEAITQGEGVSDAAAEAADCLEEAIANRIAMNLPIPEPSPVGEYQHAIALPAQMAAKASLYLAIREENLSDGELAKRLHCDEKAVRHLLDPLHPSKLQRIESALAAMGRQLVVGVQPS
jgi:antitoxin HicB